MGKLNFSNMNEATEKEHITPIQERSGKGVVGDEDKRTTFTTKPEAYKAFKLYVRINDLDIKDYIDIKIREIIKNKKAKKSDFVNELSNITPANGVIKTILIRKSLYQELSVWLIENDLQIKDVLSKIISDAIKTPNS